jgi:hypothetical protein
MKRVPWCRGGPVCPPDCRRDDSQKEGLVCSAEGRLYLSPFCVPHESPQIYLGLLHPVRATCMSPLHVVPFVGANLCVRPFAVRARRAVPFSRLVTLSLGHFVTILFPPRETRSLSRHDAGHRDLSKGEGHNPPSW